MDSTEHPTIILDTFYGRFSLLSSSSTSPPSSSSSSHQIANSHKNCVNAEIGFLPCCSFKLTSLIFRYNLKCKFITFISCLMNLNMSVLCMVYAVRILYAVLPAACSVHIIHYDRRCYDFVPHSARNDYVLYGKKEKKKL